MSKLTRRNFIQYSSLVAGGITFLPPYVYSREGLLNLSVTKPVDQGGYWYQKPLLIQQTVLREIDAKNYDAEIVVNYLKETGCNTLVINAGGIVDFFQNPLPAANVNQFMGDRDILDEITTACHSEGIKVIGRVDFRGVEEHVFNQNPDWFSLDEDQNPAQLDYTRPRLYSSCYTGHYRNEHAEEFIRYIMESYSLDGIWHNSIGVGGICYCQPCQEAYKTATGKGVPIRQSASDSELDQYMDWKTQAADQHMTRMRRAVKAFGEDKVYTAELWGKFRMTGRINSGLDLYNARDHFDFLVAVAFVVPNSSSADWEDFNYAHTTIKFLKSIAPEKEAIILYGGNGTRHRMVIEPSLDTKIWLWEMLSAGGRFWNCYFTDVPSITHDRRNADNQSEAYNFVKVNADVFEQHVPVANVGVYYSRPTRLFYRQDTLEGDSFEASIKGLEYVLMENHIQYDYIPDEPSITPESLQKYKLIILSNIRCMSDDEVEVLKNYVRNGGNLIATYATSLYDTNGNERDDYGLAELFGVHYTGQRENTQMDNYQFILNQNHPIVQEDSSLTELLFTAGYTLLSKPVQGTEVICTHVPTIHNQPPDKSWVEEFSTEFPTIVQNSYGQGSVIYFANQPDVVAHEIGHQDVRNLLLRSIRLLAGDEMPVESNAPESVHIGLTKSRHNTGEYILSLVNTTSGPARPVRSITPVQDIHVKLRLEGTTLDNYDVLRAHGDTRITSNRNTVEVKIDKLEDFSSFHIKMNT